MKAFILSCVISVLLLGCTSTGKVSTKQLKHTQWQLSHIADKSVIDSAVSIEFIEALQVAGNGGCNRFFGEGVLKDSLLRVNHIGMTRKLCDGDINKHEQMLIDMLSVGVPVLMIENMLILKGQPELRFRVAG
ncbi:Heat shock protein HslJ [Pseudoalteromonas sp. CIP111854]|uniref:Heat shock protein HslJ n=1 Tax=Pseudoalteromonas holothuriae TaxID=2963714 RepID=A0A9W4W2T6_9GAMM|nr:META domain-containing protein [Pseudoalteromonas sp. CIP111854]CAH9054991.1 Heat shock protein HslJ [Pseudoalteromonas sp. CIP111854]